VGYKGFRARWNLVSVELGVVGFKLAHASCFCVIYEKRLERYVPCYSFLVPIVWHAWLR
jgi:hypothetical protein